MRGEKLSRVAAPRSVVKTEAELRSHPIMRWDFPHLRDGDWTSVHGMPCQRAQWSADWLMAMGFSRVDACSLICDLYWDAYSELAARGLVKWLSAAKSTKPRTTRRKTKKI